VISLSSLPAGSSPHYSLSRDVAHNWLSVKSRFAGIVTDTTSTDLIDLVSSEFESFEQIIDRVNEKPRRPEPSQKSIKMPTNISKLSFETRRQAILP
jgi:hypothetical protein